MNRIRRTIAALGMLALAALLLSSVFHQPLLAQERPPIIDMHLHADLPPHEVSAGAPALCRPEPCVGQGGATSAPAETLQKTLDAMKRYNIVKGFVSGLDLDNVRKWVAADPERFIASPFILKPGQHDLRYLRKEYEASRRTILRWSLTSLLPKNSTFRS